MYLQSLELIGFKSFAHKTVLTFHPGVTAIVGPNGCGKSNLLDAVRWVLGEQSAKALRGGEMADVIFSGTDSKQAVGMAEVSLTFADCEKDLGTEYNEVRISRRVFRDGRSEYLLNKTVCRLKDIQMLFMDTGIGRTAYSIMEQGKIDLILSSRPEDRRAIFEEAAGITKYKAQKKEALRKLEYTDANLIRLADIMKEVKRQIGSLQRQAGKARRYKTLFDDLRTLDTHFSRRLHDEISRSIEEATKEIERLQNLHQSLEEQVESQEFGIAEQRREIEALEEQIANSRQHVQDLSNQADTASNRIEFNDERSAEALALSSQYKTDVEAAEQKVLAQQTQLDETDHQLTAILESLNHEEQLLKDQQSQASQLRLQRLDLERSIQEFQRQIRQQESQIAARRGELSSTLNQKEACETRLELLRREQTQTESTQTHLVSLVSTTSDDLERANGKLQESRDELSDSEHDLANSRKDLQQTDSHLTASRRTLTERESKLEVLKQLNEEGAGFGSGTQAVLKGLDKPQLYRAAIAGALANFIEVNSEYIPAIEAALGRHLQAILVREPLIGESIAFDLAEKKFGRAAVIPCVPGPKRAGTSDEPLPSGALGWALDQIKCEPNVSTLVARLLDRVVLASNLASAFEIRKNLPDVAIVTVTGEYVSRDGVVFAGVHNEKGSSVLQRKIQIRQLDEECAEAREIVENSELEQTRLRCQVERCEQVVREKQEASQRQQVHASTLQGQLSLLHRELREAEGKLKSLQWEQSNDRQRLESAIGKLASLEQVLSEDNSALESLQANLTMMLTEVESLRSDEESWTTVLNELRVRVATERQRKENLQGQRQPMAFRLGELQDLIASRQRDISHYAARIDQLSDENSGLRTRIEQLQADQLLAEAEVERLQQDRAGRVEALEAVDLNLRHLRKQLSDCQDARGQQEVRSTQLTLRLENIREHLARRYHVELSIIEPDWYAFQVCLREQRKRIEKQTDNSNSQQPTADVESSRDIDWEFVQSAIAEMTERLDAMGPVNLESIQEYDELEERQKFLDEQHGDLVKSKAELLDVINKINATTKELFAETFEQIRRNFQEMFNELFGGGKANLLLVDDVDPLESGIEIIAKPPGKQLQSISLLSGGERTMTAVSLLFAIYMVKPSPFCVLDEMDAPLDESNISRFIKILDRFVHQSQFVVITHNKRTIAKADILYGVTMEEHGISKLVSVRLTRREDSAEGTDLIGTDQSEQSIAESFGKHGNLHSETIE
ncbi:MAG TPA: chromosome segregation protein SMC [Chthoniobacterales bacterium]|nr:chromosome segregation protein SMC [Chthoniobacterales bacterium]